MGNLSGSKNYVLKKNSFYSAFDYLNDTFVPLIWFETTTRIHGDTEMGFMVVLVSNLHVIMYSIGGFSVTMGTLFLLVGIYFYRKRRMNNGHQKFHNDQKKSEKVIQRI